MQPILCEDFYEEQINSGDEFLSAFVDSGYICPNTTTMTVNTNATNNETFKMNIYTCDHSKKKDIRNGWTDTAYAADIECANISDLSYNSTIDQLEFEVSYITSKLDV